MLSIGYYIFKIVGRLFVLLAILACSQKYSETQHSFTYLDWRIIPLQSTVWSSPLSSESFLLDVSNFNEVGASLDPEEESPPKIFLGPRFGVQDRPLLTLPEEFTDESESQSPPSYLQADLEVPDEFLSVGTQDVLYDWLVSSNNRYPPLMQLSNSIEDVSQLPNGILDLEMADQDGDLSPSILSVPLTFLSSETQRLQEEMLKNADSFKKWLNQSSSLGEVDVDRILEPSFLQSTQAYTDSRWFDSIATASTSDSQLYDSSALSSQSDLYLHESEADTATHSLFCTKFVNTMGEPWADLEIRTVWSEDVIKTDQKGQVCLEMQSGLSFFLLIRDPYDRVARTFIEVSSDEQGIEHVLESKSFIQHLSRLMGVEQSVTAGGFCGVFPGLNLDGYRVVPLVSSESISPPTRIGYLNELGWIDPTLEVFTSSSSFCVFNIQQSFWGFQLVDSQGRQIGQDFKIFAYPGVFRFLDFYPEATLTRPVQKKVWTHLNTLLNVEERGDRKWSPEDQGWFWLAASDTETAINTLHLSQTFLEMTSHDQKIYEFVSRASLIKQAREEKPGEWVSYIPGSDYQMDAVQFEDIQSVLSLEDRYDVKGVLGFVQIQLDSEYQQIDFSQLHFEVLDVTGTRNMIYPSPDIPSSHLVNKRKIVRFLRVFPGQHQLIVRNLQGDVVWSQLIRIYADRIQVLKIRF